MPVYEYKALNSKGKTVSNMITSDSAAAARQMIREKQLFPVSVKELETAASGDKQKKTGFSISLRRVSHGEIAMMTRQLATLLGSGFTLVRSLSTLINQTRSKPFKRVLSKIRDAVEEGSSFADALRAYPSIYSDVYVNMVHAGESSGTLEIVLERLAEIGEKQQALQGRVISAMAYPAMMIFIGIGVLFALLTFVVPKITVIFEDMGHALPDITLFLIATSDFMKHWWWAVCILFAAIFFVLSAIRKTEKGKMASDRMILALPIVGSLARRIAAARFARTLGSLLENGVTMLPAMRVVKNITGNAVIAETIHDAEEQVRQGAELGKALGKSPHLPYLAIQMIQVGEETGELETMLTKVAEVFEREAENTMSVITSVIEPVIVLLMAAVIGFIVISIGLPIFEMNQLVQ